MEALQTVLNAVGLEEREMTSESVRQGRAAWGRLKQGSGNWSDCDFWSAPRYWKAAQSP